MGFVRPLLCGLLALAPSLARAGLEEEVKAAYVFKFLSYVEWPASAFDGDGAPIVVGVLGAEEVRVALKDIVSDRMAQGRRVDVRALEPKHSPAGMHVVYVGRSAAGELPRLASRRGVLLVSEREGALDRGAMINLLRVGDRVRFEVAPEESERSGLRISSRLLSLAQFVKSGSR